MKKLGNITLKDLVRERNEMRSGTPMIQGHAVMGREGPNNMGMHHMGMKHNGENGHERMEGEEEDDNGENDVALKIDMGPIAEALLEDVFPLDETEVSRSRLIQALVRKFGDGYKIVPAAKKALDHYDRESDIIRVIKHNRSKFRGR